MSIRHEKTETTRSGHILSHWEQKLLFFLLFINQRVVSLFFFFFYLESGRVRGWVKLDPDCVITRLSLCMPLPAGFGPNKVIVSRPPGATISVELPERFRASDWWTCRAVTWTVNNDITGTDRHCVCCEPTVLMCVARPDWIPLYISFHCVHIQM